MEKQQPIVALMYDFDKTLCAKDMQEYSFIPSVGMNAEAFWKESNELAAKNDMDQNLAYMYMMLRSSEGKVLFTKDTLRKDGAKVKLFPGVNTWFDRINQYGEENGVIVEHYIISSGLKEMIEGTKVADKFKKIYASSFYFNEKGVATWPAQVVNYTNKTQFLFRIKKGVLDINDQNINAYFEPNEYRVPFRNIVYIGDSDTDIPCMKLVNTNGGHSIGVYNSETKDKSKVFRMLEENRIKYFAPADYTEDSKLEKLLKQSFRPEFLNRLDEIVFYKPLTQNETAKILDLLIADLNKRLETQEITIELTDNAKEYLIKNGYDPVYGARPLKRFVQKKVETLIAKEIIKQTILPKQKVIIDCKENDLIIK